MLERQIGVVMYQTSRSKGQELVAQRMVRKFNGIGYKAYLITSAFHDGKRVVSSVRLNKRGYICGRDKKLGIPIIRVDSYIARWPPRRIVFRDFISTLEQIVNKFHLDVLITHSTLWNGPEEVAKFIDWRRSMKCSGGYEDPLVFCHMSHFQLPSPERYSLSERGFRVAWNEFSLPQIFSTANLILVVTPLEKESQIRLGAIPEKCFLFPSGVDDEVFKRYKNVNVNIFFNRLKIKEGTKIVSYLGSLEERKNPLAVLNVARMLRKRQDIHFVIAGRGDSSYAKKVITKAGKMPNVTYLGEISEREKVQLIASSYLNILLSMLEALGLAQLEFMYLGVPVITSAVGGQAWIIRNEIEGIHVTGPDDIRGAATAITRLVDDADLWNALSTNAQQRAETLTTSELTRKLDAAITEELIKERELFKIPEELRATLTRPENVLKSWSSGSWNITATSERVFIKGGRISKNITEIPYAKIASIEDFQQYPWNILMAGVVASVGLGYSFIFVLNRLLSLTQNPTLGTFLVAATAVPFLMAVLLFQLNIKTGFLLRGPGTIQAYIPHTFREVVTFINTMQRQHPLKKKRRKLKAS